VFGAIAALFAAMAIVFWLLLVLRVLPAALMATQQSPGVMLTGAFVYIFAAIVLIWVGRGSQTGRRWVRPVMISGTIVTAFSGFAALVPLIMGFAALARSPSPIYTATPIPRPTTSIVTYNSSGATYTTSASATATYTPDYTLIGIVTGSCGVLLFEVLPLTLLWFYGRSSVQTTLDRLDPHRRWTDRCPQAVLTWYFACILQGWGLLSACTTAVLPFFSTILVGSAAMVAFVLLAALLVGGGYLCYRMNRIGLLMSGIACLVMLGSYLTFAVVGDKQLYLNLMFANLPSASRSVAAKMAPNSWAYPVAMYTFQLIYAAWILKLFGANKTAQASPTA
jgi:hypothetical protein